MEIDACSCYPCRVYAPTTDTPFLKDGFKNWKNATNSFDKHSKSVIHKSAIKSWKEHKMRETASQTVSTMVMQRIPEHQRWVEAVFLVVRFLAVNGLPLRGDDENADFSSNEFGGGLYLNTFGDLLFLFDNSLREIAKKLPNNAKYTRMKLLMFCRKFSNQNCGRKLSSRKFTP